MSSSSPRSNQGNLVWRDLLDNLVNLLMQSALSESFDVKSRHSIAQNIWKHATPICMSESRRDPANLHGVSLAIYIP